MKVKTNVKSGLREGCPCGNNRTHGSYTRPSYSPGG